MAAPVISISSDVSVESVGSSFPRVILIGSIFVEVPLASEVGAAAVASPAGVFELDTHSSSEVDPSESSPPLVSIAPMVSPFLCSDDSKSDTEIPERHVSPTPHDAILTRWRSRVASRSSSPTTSIPEIPTAPILPAPSAIVAPSSEFPLAPDIPIGRLYRTHPGGPCRALTARKSVGPLPSHCLALRYTSHHLDHFNSGSSSHSSSDHSSSGHSISGHSLSVHTPPDTTDADSSTPHRFVHPSFTRTPRDSSSEDAGINMEVDVGDDVEDEVEDEVESNERGTMEVGVDMVVGIDIPDAMLMPDAVEHLEQVEEGLQDIYDHVIEILLQRIENIETGQRELESRSLIAGGERASLLEQNMTITRSGMTPKAIEELVNRQVEEALAVYEATRAANALEAENGNGGDGNGGDGDGENGYQNENNSDARPVARECTYQDFMKCQPLNFKGTEGVNSHKRTIGVEAAFSMSRRELMKLMAERFQELTMMCTKMVPEDEDRVEKFIGGLPDNIQGNVIAAEPTRLQDAVRIANNLMDQKLKGYAMKNVVKKEEDWRSIRETTVDSSHYSKGQMLGCKLHHELPCTVRCGKCKKVGHLTRDCKVTNLDTSTQRGQVVNQRVVTCFECGRQGHYRSNCPKLKDQNRGNKAGNKNGVGEARGKAYVLGGGDANPDSNVVKGTFLLNNHYVSMIFDSGTDRCFVSTTFSTLLDVTPDTLDVSYAVELGNGRISKTNTVLRGCTLGLLGHPFNIDLMPVELGSFDVIIGMDWLANHHAVIIYDEKIVRISYGDEVFKEN
ncbi:putative reverse transcriptase domain-containing protein [Tanacetum coccineum]